ncbi:hypothetical protein BDZ89DRAFT_1073435 [Hymenopellis radicata]|nr:hypothetical protein BDZ89DRAFT_1073435 [Hymenopellis radicata]
MRDVLQGTHCLFLIASTCWLYSNVELKGIDGKGNNILYSKRISPAMSFDDSIQLVIFGNNVQLSRRDIIGFAVASGVVLAFAIGTLCFLGRRRTLCGHTCCCRGRPSVNGGSGITLSASA